MIYPRLIYGNIAWGNNYKTRLDSLFFLKKESSACDNLFLVHWIIKAAISRIGDP